MRLSYALIFAETILAPFIPSNTARGGGLIYPVAQSLCKELYENNKQGNHGAEHDEEGLLVRRRLFYCIIVSRLILSLALFF